jgi:putative nucleotidyltransferase with HDIG domain
MGENIVGGRKGDMNIDERVLESIERLPPLPAVIHRVLQLISDKKSSAQDIVDVIQYDQSITANVLMICNSAYFALPRPVYSLRDALVRIGFNQLMEIILSRGGAYLFDRSYPGYDLAAGELWRHSAASALLSQIIADRLGLKATPVEFTAALLHDIGKVILSGFLKDHFKEIQSLVKGNHISFLEAEKQVLGIEHAELGGKISERWKFPEKIIAGIRYHHDPLSVPREQEFVSLIHLCDVLAMMTGFGGGADGLSYPGCQEIMKVYDLGERDIEGIMIELQSRLKQVELILNIQ